MLARLFALMGMYPTAYYDLSTSGLPVHATAFRPIKQESLDKNPFRLFTSLLRPELIKDLEVRKLALNCLERRNVFTPECVALVEKAESQGGLKPDDALELVKAAIETFRWHSRSPVSKEEYATLASAHKLAADICSFQSIHLNHCTPRTLDIEAVQKGMADRGIPPKALIEGPPPLPCPFLLRQTSFMAIKEPVEFRDDKTGEYVLGHHQARFGEIEQRSLALTEKGELTRRAADSLTELTSLSRTVIISTLAGSSTARPAASFSRLACALASIRSQHSERRESAQALCSLSFDLRRASQAGPWILPIQLGLKYRFSAYPGRGDRFAGRSDHFRSCRV